MKLSWEDEYEMPAEFDMSKMKRIPNPFFQKFRDLNLVSRDDDVALVFPDSEAVNVALRALMQRAEVGDSRGETLKKAC